MFPVTNLNFLFAFICREGRKCEGWHFCCLHHTFAANQTSSESDSWCWCNGGWFRVRVVMASASSSSSASSSLSSCWWRRWRRWRPLWWITVPLRNNRPKICVWNARLRVCVWVFVRIIMFECCMDGRFTVKIHESSRDWSEFHPPAGE